MRSKCARGAAILVAAGLMLFSGCIFETDEESEPKEPVPDYQPLTDKNNVIYNLLESYKWADIVGYEKLLHADYIWYNQPEDYISGRVPQPFYTRAEDIEGTNGLFKAVLGTHEDPLAVVESLTLTIQAGSWVQIAEYAGNPCEDCWETTRLYGIAVVTPVMTYYANDLVRFVVVPVMDGDRKLYKIIRADDMGN